MKNTRRFFGMLILFASLLPILVTFYSALNGLPFESAGREDELVLFGFGTSLVLLGVGGWLLVSATNHRSSTLSLVVKFGLAVGAYGMLFLILLPVSFIMRGMILPKQCVQNAMAYVYKEPMPHSRVYFHLTPKATQKIRNLPIEQFKAKNQLSHSVVVEVYDTKKIGYLRVQLVSQRTPRKRTDFLIRLFPGESCTVDTL